MLNKPFAKQSLSLLSKTIMIMIIFSLLTAGITVFAQEDCVEETAFAYAMVDDVMYGGALSDISGSKRNNRWGWYIDASAVINDGISEFEVYAGAGGNDIEKGMMVGTVQIEYIADELNPGRYYFIATFSPEAGVYFGDDEPHLGTYETPQDIPKAVGKYSNSVSITPDGVLVYHLVVLHPEY